MKTLARILPLLSLGFIITTSQLTAQWIQTNGPYGGYVSCFAVSGTNLFAGTWGGGIFLSTNNGESWTAVNNNLTNLYVRSLTVSGKSLFAGTEGGGVILSPTTAKAGQRSIPA